LEGGCNGKIAVVEEAGTTLGTYSFQACWRGLQNRGIGSHLAIVSREFSIPVLMGTKIKTDEPLNKRQAMIQPNGNMEGLLILSDLNNSERSIHYPA